MRILTPGTDPINTPRQATCGNCNAVIEFKPSEVKREHDQRDGDYFRFDCPCCGRSMTPRCSSRYNGPG